MAKIIIGCRLPNGLVLQHPLDSESKVELKGLNSSKVIGSTFVTTEVDEEFWLAWKKVHKDFPALKTGAIYEAKSEGEAKEKAKDLKKEKTGLEPMAKDAMGVKPADKKD